MASAHLSFTAGSQVEAGSFTSWLGMSGMFHTVQPVPTAFLTPSVFVSLSNKYGSAGLQQQEYQVQPTAVGTSSSSQPDPDFVKFCESLVHSWDHQSSSAVEQKEITRTNDQNFPRSYQEVVGKDAFLARGFAYGQSYYPQEPNVCSKLNPGANPAFQGEETFEPCTQYMSGMFDTVDTVAGALFFFFLF